MSGSCYVLLFRHDMVFRRKSVRLFVCVYFSFICFALAKKRKMKTLCAFFFWRESRKDLRFVCSCVCARVFFVYGVGCARWNGATALFFSLIFGTRTCSGENKMIMYVKQLVSKYNLMPRNRKPTHAGVFFVMQRDFSKAATTCRMYSCISFAVR